MATHLIRFGSNSKWEEIELDDVGVSVAKRKGYDVVPIGGEPVHCKEEGDVEVVMRSMVKAMVNSPTWWGCRNVSVCDYEAMVDEVPMPDDGLCLSCRDLIMNRTKGGVS